MSEFSRYNPIVNLIYFAAVTVFTMFIMNPVILAVSFVCASVYSYMTGGARALKFNVACLVPTVLVSAAINTLFNHAGVTILAYFPNGNPLTMEAVVYGFAAALMIAAVISYFSCINKIMTSDKLLYLTGRVSAPLSLVLTRTLRLVPRLREQLKETANVRSCMEKGKGTLTGRIKNGISIVSSVMSCALEGSAETADSMRMRGYGLKKRSSFAIYKITRRDICAIVWTAVLSVYVTAVYATGGAEFLYFPAISRVPLDIRSVSVYAAHLLLCAEPIIIELTEALKWKRLKSKI